MIGVSEHMIAAVRNALHTGEKGMHPIAGMDNHYCSLEKEVTNNHYKLMFPIEVDKEQVYIFLKIS
jgi:hypothetical protein